MALTWNIYMYWYRIIITIYLNKNNGFGWEYFICYVILPFCLYISFSPKMDFHIMSLLLFQALCRYHIMMTKGRRVTTNRVFRIFFCLKIIKKHGSCWLIDSIIHLMVSKLDLEFKWHFINFSITTVYYCFGFSLHRPLRKTSWQIVSPTLKLFFNWKLALRVRKIW